MGVVAGIERNESTAGAKRVSCKRNEFRCVFVVQMVQQAHSQHNVRGLDPVRIVPGKETTVKSPSACVTLLRGSDVLGTDVEPFVIDLGKKRQYLGGPTPYVENPLARHGPHEFGDKVTPTSLGAQCILNEIVTAGEERIARMPVVIWAIDE